MSSGKYSTAELVRLIDQMQDHIHECIQRYTKKSECKHALLLRHEIDPDITEIIWRRLEKKNEEFFRAYYGRLVLIEQIRKWNMLLEEQASWMHVSRLFRRHTYDPSPALNRQQASPSAPPLKAEDMKELHVCHNFGSSIQPSPQGFVNAPFCDGQNTKMHSVRVDDVPSGAPQNTVPLRTVNMQQRPEFGSSIPSSPILRTGYVSYPAPQYPIYGDGQSNPGYFQENVFMSGYDPNFRSSQNLVDPRNRDAMMIQTESVINREAGYDVDLACNPASYGYLLDLSPLTGDDASITGLSSDGASITSTPTKLNDLYLEEMEDKKLGVQKYEKTLPW